MLQVIGEGHLTYIVSFEPSNNLRGKQTRYLVAFMDKALESQRGLWRSHRWWSRYKDTTPGWLHVVYQLETFQLGDLTGSNNQRTRGEMTRTSAAKAFTYCRRHFPHGGKPSILQYRGLRGGKFFYPIFLCKTSHRMILVGWRWIHTSIQTYLYSQGHGKLQLVRPRSHLNTKPH